VATLPEPSQEQVAHSQQLQQVIKAAIAEQGGQTGFDQYMAMALYQPGLGYYAAGAQKFGEAGDFITSPEVSPLFAQSLARQVKQVFVELNQPVLIEFGAGSGILAADLLLELEALNALPEAYWIIELSAELQQRQQQSVQKYCAHLADKVVWLQQLPEQPVNAVVIANEVLDAMPVVCFEKQLGELYQRTICNDGDQFAWGQKIADEQLRSAITEIEASIDRPLAENYRSEFNPSVSPWLKSLNEIIDKGLVLLIDYGYDASQYYSEERNMGTLMCYYRHRAHDDVFFYPGLQDITAFVDFTAVAEAALKADFEVMGYTTQAQFLFGAGLPEIFENKMADCSDDVKKQMHLSQQVKTLTLPGEMGEKFKVMALGRDIESGLIGFSIADFRSRL